MDVGLASRSRVFLGGAFNPVRVGALHVSIIGNRENTGSGENDQ